MCRHFLTLPKDGALDYKFGNLNSDPESELTSFYNLEQIT